MSYDITGDQIYFVKKSGDVSDALSINGNPLQFNNISSLDSGQDADLTLKRNGTDFITLSADSSGNNYIDFNNIDVQNLTTSVISELGSDVTINNSLQIGNNSGYILSVDSSNNGVMSCPSGNYMTLQYNATEKLKVDTNGVTVKNGPLYLGTSGSNPSITNTSSNMYYKVGSGKNHTFYCTDTSGIVAISGSGLSCTYPIITTDVTDSSGAGLPASIQCSGGISCAKNIVCGAGATFYGTTTNGYASVKNSGSVTTIISGDTAPIEMLVRTGSASNKSAILRIAGNYLTNNLNGFYFESAFGDDSSGSNRYNSSMCLAQYMDSYNNGAAINAYEERMRFTAQRMVKFSTSGSGSNDFVISNGATNLYHNSLYLDASSNLVLANDNATKSTTNTWTVSSDSRIKQNIVDVDPKLALNAINGIRIRKYDYTQDYLDKYSVDPKFQTNKIGVIAQEMESLSSNPLLQSCVSTKGDEVFYESKQNTYTDDMGKTVSETVQVEKSRITDLKQVNMDCVNYLVISSVQQLTKQNNYLLQQLKEKDDQLVAMNDRLNALETAFQNGQLSTNVFDSVVLTNDISGFDALG